MSGRSPNQVDADYEENSGGGEYKDVDPGREDVLEVFALRQCLAKQYGEAVVQDVCADARPQASGTVEEPP